MAIRTITQIRADLGLERATGGKRYDLGPGVSVFTLLRDLIDSIDIISNIVISTVTTATYTISDTDSFLLVNRAGTVAVTIPTPLSGRVIRVKDSGGNASQYSITVTATGATIDGEATAIIGTDYDSISLISNGVDWYIF